MDARAALRQRIHDELRHLPWAVAQRLLTKAFDAWPELDAPARQGLREELDLAIEQAPPAAPPAEPPPPTTPPSAARVFDPRRIDDIIADALHAPTDGSAGRFEVLCERARRQLDLALADSQVGAFRAWVLRRRLEAGLRAERRRLVTTPGA